MKTGPRIYNLFPPLVGTIDRWSAHLGRIAAMDFNWVYLNPIHETGYSGSLYAVKDYYRLNPLFRGELGGTDDELIGEFVAAAERAGIGVMMDLVVNHTARDARLVADHPGWYRHQPDGAIASPSAADPADPSKVTVWTDLAELDYAERPERAEMIAYFANVVRHFVQLGVRGFRCDAAYKLPGAVWSQLIAAARAVRPDVLFAAETLGAPIEQVMQLRPAGFDFLFNSSKWWDFRATWLLDQYELFRHIAPSIAFPESHDTPRLVTELGDRSAAEIEAEYRFRYLFAAFFSSGVMLPIGYEYGFDRPFDVVLTRPDQWQEPRFDISAFIGEVNAMKAAIPALNEEGAERALRWDGGQAVGLVRRAEAGSSSAVALLNPGVNAPANVDSPDVLRELDRHIDVTPGRGAGGANPAAIVLQPLEIRVFSSEPLGNGAVRNGTAARDRSAHAVPATSLAGDFGGDGDARAAARPIVIENVWPEIDAGRYPIKRIVGDTLTVEADIFREGHDLIAAALKYREADAAQWREVRMEPLENDRWRGAFALERNTRYVYTIEAWPDTFATWRHGIERKRVAHQPIALEVAEGEALVAAGIERAGGVQRPALQTLQREFAQREGDERVDALVSADLAMAMAAVPDRSLATTYARELNVVADRRAAEIGAWYEFFPRSQGKTPGVASTFAEAAQRLGDVRAMGFDVLYIPPIHPIGHAFRKGKNNAPNAEPGDPGSPWAIGNADGGHTAVEPALGTLDDFARFVTAANAHGLEIALDYALQCSPDHPYVREHPEWFVFRADGSIKYAENPPKQYQDIVNFNWFGPHALALWDELRDVVEFWVARGVRIFRVDNPHTKPFAFWEWMIGDVQSRHPDVLFLAEAFTRPKVMKQLAKLGFTQSYTYFTWRNTKDELTDYCNELAHSELREYFRPNFFANTPDILPPYLQTGGRSAFLIRLVLAATLSSVYGIYSGFELCENAALPGREEYADSEKYEIRVRDWDAVGNIKKEIAEINRIRREHPALHTWRNLRFHRASHPDVLFFSKSAPRETLLIAVNLDPTVAVQTTLQLPLRELGFGAGDEVPHDELLSGRRAVWRGAEQSVRLDPARNPAAIFRVERALHADDANSFAVAPDTPGAYASPSD